MSSSDVFLNNEQLKTMKANFCSASKRWAIMSTYDVFQDNEKLKTRKANFCSASKLWAITISNRHDRSSSKTLSTSDVL